MVLMSSPPRSALPGGNRWRAAAIGVLTASLLATTVAPAAAGSNDPRERKHQVDRKITQQKHDLDETSSALTKAYADLRRTKGEVATARKKLTRAEAAVRAADEKNRETGRRLEVAQADEAKATEALEQTAADRRQTQAVVGDIARHTYQRGGLGSLSLTLQALTGGSDPVARMSLANTVLRYQKNTLHRLSTEGAERRAQESHLSAVRREVAHLKAKAEAGLLAAKQARGEAERAKRAVERTLAKQRSRARAFEAQKKRERAQLKSMQRQSHKLEQILKARAEAARERAAKRRAAKARAVARARAAHSRTSTSRSVNPAPRRGGFLSYPLNAPTSSPFGYRFHPILHIMLLHAGQDFAAACGTPVHAAASGTVIDAGWRGPSGQRVTVDHGLVRGVDLASAYYHLSRIVVYSGHVQRGQLLGYSGTTGRSTGCHLHFETRENGVPVDPMKWL
jgi:murein DD-endopeptidase MepM/ murein hydrolase activator NlpD